MYGIDKVKLVMDLEDIDIIDEDLFTKKVEGDELVELTFKQIKPFALKCKIDYRKHEVVIEFTGKVLLSCYHQLIRLSNIKMCIDNINKLGICHIKSYMSASVVVCDITNDYEVCNVRELSEYIQNNLSSYKKYTPETLPNGNFVVKKNVTSKQCKKRLTIYDKGKEMYKSENRKFLEDYYNDVNPFSGKCRFELNLNSQAQIRSSLNISDTSLKSVLLAAQSVNPIVEFLSDILCEDIDFEGEQISSVEELKKYALLKICDFDIMKVRSMLDRYKAKGTKMRAMLKPYREILAKLSDKKPTYTRDVILNLVRTTTQITPKMILDCI